MHAPLARLAASATLALTLAGGLSTAALAAPGAGANAPGPYAPIPSGASMNGNGGEHANNGQHKAVGRPMAGSVGNADAKNPPGQLPSPAADGNNGYECDANNGVGVGNPAHSACRGEGGGTGS